jgi:tetratricopeptide (TPR) repeat protein
MMITDLQDALRQFCVAACAGAIGGFVGSINPASNNAIRLMSYSRPAIGSRKADDFQKADESSRALRIELGFIGDLLVGSAAGIAIVFFVNIAANNAPTSLLHLIPITLMVGVVSKKVLVGMSEATVRKLFSETERLRDEQGQIQADVKKLDRINDLIQEGERYLKGAEEEKQDEAKLEKLKFAEATFREATQFDIGHARSYVGRAKAYVGLGKVLKRVAGEKDDPDEKRRFYQQAVDAATAAVRLDPDYERAYYNRACYKAAMGAPVDETLEDLKEAIKWNPLSGVLAESDTDFAPIRTDPRFQSVVAQGLALSRAGAGLR